MMTATATDTGRTTAMALRLFNSCLAAQELLSVYLGTRLGVYDEMAAGGPGTAGALSQRCGVEIRYMTEWLEQQAVAGFIEVDDVTSPAAMRIYNLPPEHANVLVVSDHPSSLVSLVALPLGGVAQALPNLVEAYQTGAGVHDDDYGDDWRHGHSGANRAVFNYFVVPAIAEALPELHERLQQPGARIADIACGAGWASLAFARSYPEVEIRGYDIDAPILDMARANAADDGVADRVTFHHADASTPDDVEGGFDLVCIFDALHELPYPVEVLETARRAVAPGGAVVVMDARVSEYFVAPGDDIERFQYATSVLHCLPACRAAENSAATGTVMRPRTVRAYAREAGFDDAALLPIEERFHRFYLLTHREQAP